MNSSGDAIPGVSPRAPSTDDDHAIDPADPVDIDAMVVVHLGLADALARQYAGRGVESEDLAQVARLALVRAAHRFDRDAPDPKPTPACRLWRRSLG